MSGTPDFTVMFEAVRSVFQQLGIFESVDTHEAKNAPGLGLRVEIFLFETPIMPIPNISGLDSVSYLITFQARLRSDFRQEPMDAIDPALAQAALNSVIAFTQDLNISGAGATAIDWMDPLGMYSPGLRTRAGYVNQDAFMYRVIDLMIPFVITDAVIQGL